MKKKIISAVTGLALLLTVQVGSVFADSKLDQAIGDVIGTKYKSGGTTTSGFDCSGFTTYIFKQFDIELPRTSKSQHSIGQKVAKDELQAGDLVFFNTSGKGISHVGIYVGDGKFAHASTKKGITLSSMSDSYYEKRYVGAKRVLNTELYEDIAIEPDESSDHDDVEVE